MNDQEIRDILIAYLKAENREVRIYQEKSIGNAVCDLMAVTDCLTGYEIKSDRDNFQRLDRQVAAYDRFFEQSYLVVGMRHIDSAAQRVPLKWGIIAIQDDGVVVRRKAQRHEPNCAAQLGVLWKVELTNLLTKVGLPLFTYKSKEYIIRQIVEQVEPAEIQRHVAYELLHRDYKIFDVKDYSLYFNAAQGETGGAKPVGRLPSEEIIDALSEQDLEEMTLDRWIALYAQAKELKESKKSVYQRKEVPRTPHTIPYTDIEVSLGVPWVDRWIIDDFTYFLRSGRDPIEGAGRSWYSYVRYEPLTGYWYVEDKRGLGLNGPVDRVRLESTYGLPGYNALYILEAALNLREIRRATEEETLAALEKQAAIEQLFQNWLWEDEDRRWAVEEAYQRLFQDCQPKTFSGRTLNFPEMSPDVTLYDYQKDAVMRVISEKNTLLAFDVGAGKTYIMIAAAMKMRQEGISRKNLFVVPNHIVGQWELIFKKMYPTAKVLSVGPESFRPQMRQKVLGQIQHGDYDGIIMAYSCFELIPLSADCLLTRLSQETEKLETALQTIRHEAGIGAALEREKAYLTKQISGMMKKLCAHGDEITFDQLEVNTLFVDEAHNFKNIPLRSAMKGISGVNIKGSEKCLAMLHKVRSVQDNNQGRGAVFATGTPLCNSISDAYAMQMYLQYDKLKETHLDRFDNWVKSFAKPEQVCEIDVNASKFRFVLRFARFFNLPELSKLFSQIAAFYTVDDKDGLPRLEQYSDVLIPRNTDLQSYMNELCRRSERIRRKKVDRTMDNMLKVSTDGRKAALDLRLVGRKQAYNETSKIYRCVQQTMKIYEENAGCSQIIFCDYSTPKEDRFHIYAELKRRMVERGVPVQEIAFVHSCHSEAEKVRLFEKVNRGVVRILLGSTFKLGIGANVQTRLKAIHHLDVPWRPSDMVQREGRILRRGNMYEEIQIYRYIAEGSFDAYSWQLLETKQRFISQFLSASECQRSASDLEENVLTYAQVKALAISQPLMKVLAEKENELSRLQMLSSNHARAREERRSDILNQERMLSRLEQRITATIENAKYVEKFSEDAFQTAYNGLKEVLTKDVLSGNVACPVNDVLDFRLIIPERVEGNTEKAHVFLERSEESYLIQTSESAPGNARRVVNFLKRLHQVPQKLREECERCRQRLEELQTMEREENPYLDDMEALKQEIVRLHAELGLKMEKIPCAATN